MGRSGGVRWDLAEKLIPAGYDMLTALEMADKYIEEFLASGAQEQTFGIMGAMGKCVDTFTFRRKEKHEIKQTVAGHATTVP